MAALEAMPSTVVPANLSRFEPWFLSCYITLARCECRFESDQGLDHKLCARPASGTRT